MGVKVRRTRSGFLALRVIHAGWRKWIGTKLRDTAENRERLEHLAALIALEIRQGMKLRLALQKHLRWDPIGMLPDETVATAPPAPLTVREYFHRWIKRQVPPRVRIETGKDRRWYFEAAILPRLGDLLLRDVTTADLAALRDELLARGPKGRPLKVRTVRKVIGADFRAFWTEARAIDRLVAHDPFLGLTYPDWIEEAPDPFTEEERDRILEVIRRDLPAYYPFVYFQFWTGCRPSEAAGLRIGDLNLVAGRADIRRGLVRGQEGAPKTRASRRTIDLLPGVVEVLADVRGGLNRAATAFVFSNGRGRPLRHECWAPYYWKAILAAAKVREREFYATRHTFISVALSHGELEQLIAEQCGTSSQMIRKHYGRYIRPRRFTVLASLEAEAKVAPQVKREGETRLSIRKKSRRKRGKMAAPSHLHDSRIVAADRASSDGVSRRSFFARVAGCRSRVVELPRGERDRTAEAARGEGETGFTSLRIGDAHADLIRKAWDAA